MSEDFDDTGRRKGFEYFNCTVVRESKKARLVRILLNGIGAEYWVPNTLHAIRQAETGESILEVRTWYAHKNGLIGDELN